MNETKFAKLSLRQMIYIDTILEVESMFVSQETVNEINNYFGLKGLNDEDLRASRNSIVKYISDDIKKHCVKNNRWTNYDLHDKLNCKMSMLTAVFDKEMWSRGMMV